jgi:hypothetical protein
MPLVTITFVKNQPHADTTLANAQFTRSIDDFLHLSKSREVEAMVAHVVPSALFAAF